MEHGEATLWDHLPLLVSANSKDSVESILQTLWRTRKTGVSAADRATICNMLQLESDSDLDPVISFPPYVHPTLSGPISNLLLFAC